MAAHAGPRPVPGAGVRYWRSLADLGVIAEAPDTARWAAAWAQTHAEHGDYEYALKWLDVVRRSGGLSPDECEQRRRWTAAVRAPHEA